MRDGDGRSDAWVEIENMIAQELERRYSMEMLDVNLARMRARECAISIVRGICAMLPGVELYVPHMPRHHRGRRREDIQREFHGDVRESARLAGCSQSLVRKIVIRKK